MDDSDRDPPCSVPPKVTDAVPAFNVEHFLAHPGNGRRVVRHAKRSVIFSQGHEAGAMFFILKGEVRLTVASGRRKESVLAMLREGDFFGESCLLENHWRTYSAIAHSMCLVMQINREVVAEAVKRHPALAERLMTHFLRRTLRVEEDLVNVMVSPSRRRLARAIWQLANADGQGIRQIRISQATLANMIGTTRSRVSEFMTSFQKDGHITFDGPIDVHPSLLNVVEEEDEATRESNFS